MDRNEDVASRATSARILVQWKTLEAETFAHFRKKLSGRFGQNSRRPAANFNENFPTGNKHDRLALFQFR